MFLSITPSHGLGITPWQPLIKLSSLVHVRFPMLDVYERHSYIDNSCAKGTIKRAPHLRWTGIYAGVMV
jgi:hypothetical protein